MSCCDTLSEEINGLKIEISRLVNRKFDLECEVERLRSIADDLYAYIVSDAGISLKIIEEQMDWMDWREEE